MEDTKLHFEEFAVGDSWRLTPFCVSEAEIFAFARKWDPQPYHIDPEAASHSKFGGIVASGIHTLAMAVRHVHDAVLHRTAAAAGVGIDNLRFLAPLRPGDAIAGAVSVLELSSNPARAWGLVTFRTQLSSQLEGLVLSFDNRVLVWQRGDGPAS